jgi:hypothetical protein
MQCASWGIWKRSPQSYFIEKGKQNGNNGVYTHLSLLLEGNGGCTAIRKLLNLR